MHTSFVVQRLLCLYNVFSLWNIFSVYAMYVLSGISSLSMQCFFSIFFGLGIKTKWYCAFGCSRLWFHGDNYFTFMLGKSLWILTLGFSGCYYVFSYVGYLSLNLYLRVPPLFNYGQWGYKLNSLQFSRASFKSVQIHYNLQPLSWSCYVRHLPLVWDLYMKRMDESHCCKVMLLALTF